MRISILSGDPGYPALQKMRAEGRAPRVYLDGERVEGCITADEEHGFVTVAVGDWKDPLNRRNRRGMVEIRAEAEQGARPEQLEDESDAQRRRLA